MKETTRIAIPLYSTPVGSANGNSKLTPLSDCIISLCALQLLSEKQHAGGFRFPDGTQLGPSDIFAEAPEPRKFCIAFDTCDASRLIPFARGADILVSLATQRKHSEL